jgi:hypothetical protein
MFVRLFVWLLFVCLFVCLLFIYSFLIIYHSKCVSFKISTATALSCGLSSKPNSEEKARKTKFKKKENTGLLYLFIYFYLFAYLFSYYLLVCHQEFYNHVTKRELLLKIRENVFRHPPNLYLFFFFVKVFVILLYFYSK